MTLLEHMQKQFDGIVVPKELSPLRAEIWKAAVRRSIQAVNAAIRNYEGDRDEA